jgi:hypothetical protein
VVIMPAAQYGGDSCFGLPPSEPAVAIPLT